MDRPLPVPPRTQPSAGRSRYQDQCQWPYRRRFAFTAPIVDGHVVNVLVGALDLLFAFSRSHSLGNWALGRNLCSP